MALEAPVKQIGPYRVLSTLGKGGMATVYKCEDTREGKVCAVKMMASVYTERKDMALRFRREFRAIRRLHHPNIVEVTDAGEWDGGFYFAMEFVDGVDLAKYFGLRAAGKHVKTDVLQAPGRVRKVVEVSAQIAEALLYIHGERIVHRDMKPTNVFITREGHVKLMDFGIAKELDQTAALTRHGSFLGTAYYTAPEQIKASQDLDGRADLYALGIMMYEALAGRLPFYSDNTVEVLRMHILEAPPPMRPLNGKLPEDVCLVVLKLLAKDPQERYRDASELGQALRALHDFPKDQDTREWAVPAIARRPVVASGLVGRQKELARLIDGVDAATVGQPVLASVTGCLGIGKTRLLRALEEHVRGSSALFLGGRYHADRAAPYLAWREALAASVTYLMGFGIPFAQRVVGSHGRILRTIAPAFERMEPDRPAPARLQPEEERLRLFEAVQGYLRALARQVPLCISLDSAQWAYEADFELAAYLLRGFAGSAAGARPAPASSVMLCITYRDDEVPTDHPLRKLTLQRPEGLRFVEIRLPPFTIEEVRDFLLAMSGSVTAIGGSEALERLSRQIHAETGGNPYHVEEMAKAQLGHAAIAETPAPAEPGEPPATPDIVSPLESTRAAPATGASLVSQSSETTRRHVGDLVMSRVRKLSDDAQVVLRAAAVIGEGIEFDILAELAEVDEDLLLDIVDELIRDKFLVERDRGDQFELPQTLVKDAIYGSLPDEVRVRLHRRMVGLLSERAGKNPEGYAALLALHAERSGDPTRAAASYVAAGDAALRGNRVDEAERFFDQARQLLPRLHAGPATTSELDLEVRRGTLLLARGEPSEAARVFESIMGVAKDRGDMKRAGDVARKLGIAYARAGNHVLAIANLEWALNVARVLKDEELEADARDGLGSAQLVRGNFDRALDHMRAALALRKAQDDRVGAARALYGAARALHCKGELLGALKMHKDALAFAVNLVETGGAARGHVEIADIHRQLGEPEAARTHLEQALDLGRKAGARDVEIAALISTGLMALGRGELRQAGRSLDEATQLARGVGDKKLLATALLAAGDEALMRHDLAAAKARIEEARALSNQLGDRVGRANSARALARVALKAKALDSARAYLTEARHTHGKIGARLGTYEDLVDEGALALQEAISQTSSGSSTQSPEGRALIEPARQALQATLGEARETVAQPLIAAMRLMQGELELALRHAEPAIEAAEEAYTLGSASGRPDLCQRARVVCGRAFLLARDTGKARIHYREALEILKSFAASLPDRAERLAFLSEPDRRSLVEEVKMLASIGKPAEGTGAAQP